MGTITVSVAPGDIWTSLSRCVRVDHVSRKKLRFRGITGARQLATPSAFVIRRRLLVRLGDIWTSAGARWRVSETDELSVSIVCGGDCRVLAPLDLTGGYSLIERDGRVFPVKEGR